MSLSTSVSTTSDSNTNPPPARRTAGQLLIAPVSGWPAPTPESSERRGRTRSGRCGRSGVRGATSVRLLVRVKRQWESASAFVNPFSRYSSPASLEPITNPVEPDDGLAGAGPPVAAEWSRRPIQSDAVPFLPALSVTAARGFVLPDSLAALSFRTKTVPIEKSPDNFVTRNAEVTEDPVSDEQEFKFSEQQSFAYGASDEWRDCSR